LREKENGHVELTAFILLCVFWLLFMGRTVMLMLRGIRVFVLAKGKSLPARLLEIILMPALVLWSLQVAFTAFDAPLIPATLFWQIPFLRIIGLILCAGGLVVFVFALISFGSAWRVGIDEEKSDKLVTGGIFKLTRNPIFLFMDMYFLGTFLIFPNWFFLAFFIFAAVGVHRQILNEEQFLRSKFGEAYDGYMKKTRRYV
jgi:protein-S-isoprenylcysteine O-methyltransferase Ste14